MMSTPPIEMDPEVGSISRLIMRSVVVLPHPDGPMSAMIEPAGTSRVNALTASLSLPGKRFVSAAREMALASAI